MKGRNPKWEGARFYIALALLVQSFAFLVTFIVLCVRKKSIAGAFLAVSAAEGGVAAMLLAQMRRETCEEFEAVKEALASEEDDIDEDQIAADLACGVEEESEAPKKVEIPCEEQVSEEEFL